MQAEVCFDCARCSSAASRRGGLAQENPAQCFVRCHRDLDVATKCRTSPLAPLLPFVANCNESVHSSECGLKSCWGGGGGSRCGTFKERARHYAGGVLPRRCFSRPDCPGPLVSLRTAP